MALSKFAKEDVCPVCGAKRCKVALLESEYAEGILRNGTICNKVTFCEKCNLKFEQHYLLSFTGQTIEINEKVHIPAAKPL